VRRLLGEDAGFLALELPIQPMNSQVLALLGAADTPIDLAYVRRHMVRRLDELPVFRWRVEPVPFGLNHPVYVDDPSFDLDHHLRAVTLRPPAGPVQLDRFYARLAEQRLDRRHPLWRLNLVNGLPGGRQAIVLQIHHCLMDGFATIAALSRIFSTDDHDAHDAHDDHDDHDAAGPPPRPFRLVAEALRDHARATRRLPALVRTTMHNLAALKADHQGSTVAPQPGGDAPPQRSGHVGVTG